MLRTSAERLGTERFFLFGVRGGLERQRNPCRSADLRCLSNGRFSLPRGFLLASPPAFTLPPRQASPGTYGCIFISHSCFSPQAKLFLLQEARPPLKTGALHGLGLI